MALTRDGLGATVSEDGVERGLDCPVSRATLFRLPTEPFSCLARGQCTFVLGRMFSPSRFGLDQLQVLELHDSIFLVRMSHV